MGVCDIDHLVSAAGRRRGGGVESNLRDGWTDMPIPHGKKMPA